MSSAAAGDLRTHPDVTSAFISEALAHAYGPIQFYQPSASPVPLPMSSVMVGT